MPRYVVEASIPGLQGPRGVDGVQGIPGTNARIIDTITLNNAQAIAQQITLTATPLNPGTVKLDVRGAPPQVNGEDYGVTGNVLSWAGFSLETSLAAGDVLIVDFSN